MSISDEKRKGLLAIIKYYDELDTEKTKITDVDIFVGRNDCLHLNIVQWEQLKELMKNELDATSK